MTDNSTDIEEMPPAPKTQLVNLAAARYANLLFGRGAVGWQSGVIIMAKIM
jgi:hypothetical protein